MGFGIYDIFDTLIAEHLEGARKGAISRKNKYQLLGGAWHIQTFGASSGVIYITCIATREEMDRLNEACSICEELIIKTPTASYKAIFEEEEILWSEDGWETFRAGAKMLILEEWGPTPPKYYSLWYTAGEGGYISGQSQQAIVEGGNGTSVEAVPNEGHSFSEWSDGVATAARVELNVQENVWVTAYFVEDEPSTDEPSTDEPSTDEPSTDEPSTDEPSTDEPSTDEPSTDEPSTDEPSWDFETDFSGDLTGIFAVALDESVVWTQEVDPEAEGGYVYQADNQTVSSQDADFIKVENTEYSPVADMSFEAKVKLANDVTIYPWASLGLTSAMGTNITGGNYNARATSGGTSSAVSISGTPSDWVHIKAEIVSDTIYVKCWYDGSEEPGDFGVSRLWTGSERAAGVILWTATLAPSQSCEIDYIRAKNLDEPSTDEPSTDEPSTDEPSTDEPST